MDEDDWKKMLANLLFWAIVFAVVLCSLTLEAWQAISFWTVILTVAWAIKWKWGK